MISIEASSTNSFDLNSTDIIDTSLKSWNLPESVVKWFEDHGIQHMFPWQAECLKKSKILEGKSLVLSAPTSAGKTMISDVLLLKNATRTKKKTLIILPYVSVTREKMLTLKSMFRESGIRVGGFMGGTQPPGGLQAVNVAVCTIEKANSLINKLIEEKRLATVSTVIVDELHLLGDESRGFILELILAKLSFMSKKKNLGIQFLGMSATLPGVEQFAKWLKAEFYKTDFRPVTLTERLKIGNELFTSTLSNKTFFEPKYSIPSDVDDIVHLTFDTIINNHGILIFCSSRKACELLAKNIANNIKLFGQKDCKYLSLKEGLRKVLNRSHIKQILKHLERLPFNLDQSLCEVLMFGVAYHHAGLTIEERDIIEDGFRKGTIKVLVATSTLCSGVNLPARRVVIHSPLHFRGHCKQMMDISTYKQMIGRAGRKGIDTEGESFLVCNEAETEVGKTLFTAQLNDVRSCLISDSNSIKEVSPRLIKAILEVITLGVVNTESHLLQYLNHTFLAIDHQDFSSISRVLSDKCLRFLESYKFIEKCEEKYFSTRLGNAVVSSSINPMDGLYFVAELDKASTGFILKNDLHILYQVIPPYLSHHLDPVHWEIFGRLWDQLDDDSRKVGEAVGVNQKLVMAGFNSSGKKMEEMFNKDCIANHFRFYSALALNDVIQEMPLFDVTQKYKISKGQLQSMQHNVGTFASMIAVFCNKLGWNNLEILIDQFHGRLHFGIQKELIDLMKLSCLSAGLARCLYESGFDTIASVAQSNLESIREALRKFKPFQSSENETNVWIAGKARAMNIQEISEETLKESRSIIEKTLGKFIEWDKFDTSLIVNGTEHNSSSITPETSFNGHSCGDTSSGIFESLQVFHANRINIIGDKSAFASCLSHFENVSKVSVIFEFDYSPFQNFPPNISSEYSKLRLLSENLLVTRMVCCIRDEVFVFENEEVLLLLSEEMKNFFISLKVVYVYDIIRTFKVFRQCFNCNRKVLSHVQWMDPKVGDWLIDPDQKKEPKSLELLISKRVPQIEIERKEALKTNISSVVDCASLEFVTETIKEELARLNLLSTFEKCEIPSLINLAEMELTGIGVDSNYIQEEKEKYTKFLNELKFKAFQQAKHNFDLSSPKDIAHVLYTEKNLLSKAFDLFTTKNIRTRTNDKLKLSQNLKTSKSVLEKLSKVDELPGIILKWRRLNSAIRKSLNGVISHMYYDTSTEMHRVSGKSDYWSVTGRLSMSDPNLMCIERDFDVSLSPENLCMVSIRKSFIAQSGYKLISTDFQQLELRILAHYSDDEKLLSELNNGTDVFKSIAANIHDKTAELVTFEERQQAKAICYGIIYGVGKRELSTKLGVVEEAAEEFRDKFLESYPNIKKFKEKSISCCETEGFVECIDGRRRYLSNIKDKTCSLRMKAERQAVNTRIQGSASFVVKKFVNKVNEEIMSQEIDAKLVLQIHDEFLFEVRENVIETFKKLVEDCSSNSDLNLKVDLPLKVRVGLNWAEME
ncbi:hypothetical protein B4U80_10485 [Leptotrombidium deliense]|uniref:DNA-directed DNA polymerase n=1 Tax=Leptotrombidium deliense TaxID=299467 RepID=A0A443SH65_9ACAR|nr:hypothetical protein B4U80_10485 [Leptotrombidium deliense]